MRLRKLLTIGLSSVLAFAGILSINAPLAFAAAPYNCTWTGGGANNDFSTAGNWSDCNGAAPQPADGDTLIFPAGAARLSPQNDLTSPTFGGIEFTGSTAGTGYDITGFSLTALSIDDTSSVGTGTGNIINVPTISLSSGAAVLSSNQQLIIGISSLVGSDTLALGSNQVSVGPNVAVYSNVTGTNQLTVAGVGNVYYANNTFSGAVALSSNAVVNLANSSTFADASLLSTNGTGGVVQGGGDVGDSLDIAAGGTVVPGGGGDAGCFTTDALTMDGTYDAVLNGSTACTDYTAITASGAITIGGNLDLSLANNFTATTGQTFTILNNTSGSAISGTFTGQPEGSTITVGNYTFAISYVGGNGHSIVLTVTGAPGASGTSAPKAPDTGLAALIAHPFATLFTTTAAALMIVIIARRLRPVKS